jgi:hypothetical protein
MAALMPRSDMTLSASVRGDWNVYPTQIGRQGYDTSAAALQWEWRFQTLTTLSAWVGVDHSSLHLANVNDAAVDTPDDTLGGATYPLANRWWAADEERNWSGGATLRHQFHATRWLRPTSLDLSWNYQASRGITSYIYASPGALTYPAVADIAGNQFPAMTYIVNSLTMSYTIPLSDRAALRLYDYYERGQISDWHYDGFANSLVYDRYSVYTDAGPQGYRANVAGLFVSFRL